MGWARLLKRVFNIDLEHCPQCGGEFKIIAAIEEPGLACPRTAALTSPAAGALPSGLILKTRTVLQWG